MRYIIKHTNTNTAATGSLKNRLEKNNISIVDDTLLPELGLVQSDNHSLSEVKKIVGSDWSVYAEKKYAVPDTKHSIGKKNKN